MSLMTKSWATYISSEARGHSCCRQDVKHQMNRRSRIEAKAQIQEQLKEMHETEEFISTWDGESILSERLEKLYADSDYYACGCCKCCGCSCFEFEEDLEEEPSNDDTEYLSDIEFWS